MLEFRQLKIKGFRSFRDEASAVLASAPELVYVTGRNDEYPELGANAAGKSSLVEAIHWCLFGKTSDGLRAGDVANWNSKSPVEVELRVSVDGVKHRIRRTWRPNSLEFDHRPVDQETIRAALGLEADTFCHSIFHAQEFVHFSDLPPAVQMDVYSTLLRLDLWEEAATSASDQSKMVRASVQELAVANASLRGKLSEVRGELDERSEQETQWWRDQKTILKSLRRDKRDAERRMEKVKQALTLAESGRKIDYRNLRSLEEQHSHAVKSLAECRAKTASIKDSIRTQEDDLSRIRDGEPCPVCGQPTDVKHVHKYADKKLDDWEAKLIALRKAESELMAHSLKTNRQVTQERERIREVEREQSKAFGKAESEYQAARDRLLQITRDADHATTQACPFDTTDLRKRRDDLRSGLREGVAQEKKMRWSVDAFDFWVKGFREIRLMLIAESLLQLEISVNDALAAIGLSDWAVEFSAEMRTKGGKLRKAFSIMVRSPHNSRPVPFAAWSGGERQRLRLAITLGLSDVIQDFAGLTSDLEIFDEPTQHLSQEGIGQLLELLRDRARARNRSVWLIDHRVFAAAPFDRMLICHRDRTGSRIYEE